MKQRFRNVVRVVTGAILLPAPLFATDAGTAGDALDTLRVLEREYLISAVLERNPNVVSAQAAWEAAAQRPRQASALEDPMAEYMFGPGSIGSDVVRYGQVVQLRQAFPWFGKRGLHGKVARAEADAVYRTYEGERERLALAASLLLDEYFAVERSLDINRQHFALVEDVLATARAQYEAGRAPQREPLRADLELAHIEHERVRLVAQRREVTAAINGLLHRRPDAALPPPPLSGPDPAAPLQESAELQDLAVSNRPVLQEARALLQARTYALTLAGRESYPDFALMASYNSMWAEPEHRYMVGLALELPLQIGARRGATAEARAELRKAEAWLAALTDAVRVEVDQAHGHLVEAQHVVDIHRRRLLPTARAEVDATRIAYATGRGGFEVLIGAERSLRTLELDYQVALANLGQRRAELDYAVGRMVERPDEGGAP